MKNRSLSWTAASVAIALMLALSRIALAADEHSKDRATPEQSSDMASFYTGGTAKTGAFTGKLVCLRCDLKPGPESMQQCAKEGHRHALSMDSDRMIHPLLAGTAKVAEQINSGALHDKEVTVYGKYYPSTAAILVTEITEQK